jgi:S-adenosylmethionine hydrolase
MTQATLRAYPPRRTLFFIRRDSLANTFHGGKVFAHESRRLSKGVIGIRLWSPMHQLAYGGASALDMQGVRAHDVLMSV